MNTNSVKMYYAVLKSNPHIVMLNRRSKKGKFWEIDTRNFSNAADCGWSDISIYCGAWKGVYNNGMNYNKAKDGVILGIDYFFDSVNQAYRQFRACIRNHNTKNSFFKPTPTPVDLIEQRKAWAWLKDNVEVVEVKIDFYKMFATAPRISWDKILPKNISKVK